MKFELLSQLIYRKHSTMKLERDTLFDPSEENNEPLLSRLTFGEMRKVIKILQMDKNTFWSRNMMSKLNWAR